MPLTYHLPNDSNKTITYYIMCQREHVHCSMCKYYATYDGLLNGANGLFKTTCMNNKSYIWIDFQNPKISYHTRHKNAFIYTNKNFNKVRHM
jgi:hypothetical protein